MWIRTNDPSDKDAYLDRENQYAKHIERNKTRFTAGFFRWFGMDELHDSRLSLLSFDERRQKLNIQFDFVGLWIGNPPGPPRMQRLVFEFSTVEDVTVFPSDKGHLILKHLTYIISEINTHPRVTRTGSLKSLVILLSGEQQFELTFLFKKVSMPRKA